MKNNNDKEALIINAFLKDPRNNDFFQYFKIEKLEK